MAFLDVLSAKKGVAMPKTSLLPGLGRPHHETRRLSRILQILRLVDANPHRYNRKALATHFEVSVRMIQKDLDVIRHGLKVEMMSSHEGYHLPIPPGLPHVKFNFGEALALLLAVQTARCNSGIHSTELDGSVTRLESLFPKEFIPYLKKLQQCAQRQVSGKNRQEILDLLHRALFHGSKVTILYRTGYRKGEESRRTVHPYHIMPYVRSWHLIGHCEMRGKVLTFKVDRIGRAELLHEHYQIPPHFNLDDYMGDAWGLMHCPREEPVEVELLFEPEAGRWVAEEHWHKSQRVKHLSDGSIRFQLFLPLTPDFVGWILYYGSRVQVIWPPELRDRVKQEHQRASEQYA